MIRYGIDMEDLEALKKLYDMTQNCVGNWRSL